MPGTLAHSKFALVCRLQWQCPDHHSHGPDQRGAFMESSSGSAQPDQAGTSMLRPTCIFGSRPAHNLLGGAARLLNMHQQPSLPLTAQAGMATVSLGVPRVSDHAWARRRRMGGHRACMAGGWARAPMRLMLLAKSMLTVPSALRCSTTCPSAMLISSSTSCRQPTSHETGRTLHARRWAHSW